MCVGCVLCTRLVVRRPFTPRPSQRSRPAPGPRTRRSPPSATSAPSRWVGGALVVRPHSTRKKAHPPTIPPPARTHRAQAGDTIVGLAAVRETAARRSLAHLHSICRACAHAPQEPAYVRHMSCYRCGCLTPPRPQPTNPPTHQSNHSTRTAPATPASRWSAPSFSSGAGRRTVCWRTWRTWWSP